MQRLVTPSGQAAEIFAHPQAWKYC
jgi:hypothetical protein